MNDEMTDEEAYLMAYGIYLLNGGRKEDFLDLTPDDVQIMTHTHAGLEGRKLRYIATMLGGKID